MLTEHTMDRASEKTKSRVGPWDFLDYIFIRYINEINNVQNKKTIHSNTIIYTQ